MYFVEELQELAMELLAVNDRVKRAVGDCIQVVPDTLEGDEYKNGNLTCTVCSFKFRGSQGTARASLQSYGRMVDIITVEAETESFPFIISAAEKNKWHEFSDRMKHAAKHAQERQQKIWEQRRKEDPNFDPYKRRTMAQKMWHDVKNVWHRI
eukprot:GDKI01007357.1.p2 GENE.GDKI01007357.1~~GDKI01007357.1.p2  ORF type:complete len:153 (-),score=57.23 GDKI01007357.1:278-736(-)